jgi:branched-chain amino acid transport system substrate-binding protein
MKGKGEMRVICDNGGGGSFLKITIATTLFLAWLMAMGILPLMAKEGVKIAVLTDQSDVYAGITKSNVDAVKMAVEDFGGKVLGQPIVVLDRDHKNKPGIATQKAKELYEKEGVDVIFDVCQSACGLAVSEQANIYKKLFFSVSSGTTEHVKGACNLYTFDWGYNDYMLATSVGLWAAENLGKKWYTITADYAWGHDLLKNFTSAVEKKGGRVIGNDMVALGASDFSPYIIKAMNSGADVLVLLNGGKDTVNSTKQAFEFGLKKKMKIVYALVFDIQVVSVGANVFQDGYVTSPWYWKSPIPGARDFADRWFKKFDTRPHFLNAANYSATLQYLNAVKRAGTKNPKAVIKQLEGLKFNDLFAHPGYVRPENHSCITDAFIVRVKKPEEITEKWDVFQIVGKVPAEEAYGPPSPECKMPRL